MSGGSSWAGFWKRPDRGQAWLEVATCALKTHNGYIAAANILNTPESAAAMRKLRRMCGWALNRAERFGIQLYCLKCEHIIEPAKNLEMEIVMRACGWCEKCATTAIGELNDEMPETRSKQ